MTHFAWGQETEDRESVLAGGGRYEYDPERDVYVEHIQYHSDSSMNEVTLRFEARVEGDTWYHIGEVGDYKLREVWKRVDPEQVRAELRGDTMTGERPAASPENPWAGPLRRSDWGVCLDARDGRIHTAPNRKTRGADPSGQSVHRRRVTSVVLPFLGGPADAGAVGFVPRFGATVPATVHEFGKEGRTGRGGRARHDAGNDHPVGLADGQPGRSASRSGAFRRHRSEAFGVFSP